MGLLFSCLFLLKHLNAAFHASNQLLNRAMKWNISKRLEIKSKIYFHFVNGLICKKKKRNYLFKNIKFECNNFLSKDSTNYKWQWDRDRVSDTQFLFQVPKIHVHFPSTAVLYLTNLAVLIFFNNHDYTRCKINTLLPHIHSYSPVTKANI